MRDVMTLADRSQIRPRRRAGALTTAGLALASVGLAGCGQTAQVGSSASTTTSPGMSDAGTSASTTPATGSSSAQSGTGTSGSASGAPGQGTTCAYPVDGSPAKPVDPPSTTAVPNTGTTTVTMHLPQGNIALTLNRAAAPCTVNSFVSLAKQGYFTKTACHRLTTQGLFVLQCGDPSGTGSGGPGYSFKDELTGKEKYPKGTVAMANAGPDTNGSQFFLVYEDTQLQPNYTVFGTMDASSLAVVKKIADAGTKDGGGHGAPAADTTISQVTLG